MTTKYLNRQEAGRILAENLRAYAKRNDVIVLALPRGGVPVAFEVSTALHVPLDVYIVRKLGVPGQSELAMGAIAAGGVVVFNDSVVKGYHIQPEEIDAVLQKEKQELARREMAYRGTHDFPSLKHKTVILVDDGIATGASARAAIKALRELHPAKIILAVPVADDAMCHDMRPLVDELYCPLKPKDFYAVGAWYEDFSQTEDEEVYDLLKKANQ